MNDSPKNLSESQKTCLRLVGRGMVSKEIAIETGLSPQTVDTYIKIAINRLGASDRRDAARIRARWEASQDLGSPPGGVAVAAIATDQETAAGGRGWSDWLLPPPVGGRPNDLSPA